MDRELDAFLSGHIYIEDDTAYQKKAAVALSRRGQLPDRLSIFE